MRTISIKGLSKSFEGKPVFKGLSMEVEIGRVTAILGPSGRGKTTLLRILCGLEREDGGSAILPEELGMAVSFQEPRLLAWLTVEENLSYCLGEGAKGDALASLKELGLEGFASRMPSTMSGGEQQRVNLARALASKAKLLLLDEPFSSIDLALKGKMLPKLRDSLASQGRTVIMVTHSPVDVALMADKFYLMDEQGSGARGPYEVLLPEKGRMIGDEATGREVHRLMLMMASLGPEPGMAMKAREGYGGR